MLPTNTAAPRVTVIDPRTPEQARLRVAAYCRVSSDSAYQLNSYLAQVDFYTKHINENPNSWWTSTPTRAFPAWTPGSGTASTA